MKLCKPYRWMAVMLAAIMILSLVGCGKKSDDTGKEKVVLNEVAHSIFYAPLYVAIEEGYFSDAGIDLELVTGFGADKTVTAVLTDEADIGFMGCETTIYTYLGKTDDPVINFAQLTQRAGNFLVSRESEPDFKWEDLKGKTVLGGRKGGMPEMVFEYILKQNNIDPKSDLTIDQSIDFGATAAAFSSGQGDYTVEFEPFATKLEEMKDGYVVASLGKDSGFVPYTSFSAKKSYIESHQSTLEHFCEALQKAMDYVNQNSSADIAKIIAPQFEETDVKTIETIVDRYKEQNTWKDNLVFEKESFDLLQNILEDAGELSERVPYENLVDTKFADAYK